MKRLIPAYHLQHCEVSTPFKLPNGETLLFELTLHQTLVISVFNDEQQDEAISFDQILRQTGINEKLLSLVLKSFTNVGLLKRNGTTYSFNPEYQPDLRKVVNNKIRISLPKSGSNGPTRANDKSTTATATATAEHTEGLRSDWKRELLCACIVRSLKGLPSPGLTRGELVRVVQTQIRGFSVGEFREALAVCLRDGYVAVGDDGLYTYA